MMKANYKIIVSFIMLLFIGFLIIYNNAIREEEGIKKYKVVERGFVSEVVEFPRGDGLWVRYKFKVHEHWMEEKKRLFIPKRNLVEVRSILVGLALPVVYDSTNFNNDLLLSGDDFVKYGINVTDTLHRILTDLGKLK